MNILLVKDDKDTREMIAFALEGQFEAKVTRADSYQRAFEVLLEDSPVSLIICDDSEANIKLFKYLLSVESAIPLILLRQTEVEVGKAFPDLNVIASLESKDVVESLKDAVLKALQDEKITITGPVGEYCRIKTELLVRVVPLKADIYIRLSDIKYVRLFKRGDVFDSGDLERILIAKKIEYLYLKKAEAEEFISKFKSVLAEIIDKGKVGPLDAPELSSSIHEAVLDISGQFGFTPEVQGLVRENVKMILHGVKQAPALSQLLDVVHRDENKYISAHSVMVAHVASLLANEMTWTSDMTFEKLSYAALLHDVTLKNQALATLESAEELKVRRHHFTEAEARAFLNHPNESADIAMRFTEIPADVGIIIREHHEKPDGTGFPRKLNAQRIAPISSLFIIAHHFVRTYFVRKEGLKEFIARYGDYYKVGAFRKVIEAFKKQVPLDKIKSA